MVEWSCEEDGKQALRDNRTYDTWQEGLLLIFKVVLANKPFILSVYRSVSREQIETYLFGLTCELIENVVEEKSVGRNVSAEEKRFIAEVYKYSFVGIMLDWVKQGMKERPEVLVDKLGTALCGSVENSVGNFERKKRGQKRERKVLYYGKETYRKRYRSAGSGSSGSRRGSCRGKGSKEAERKKERDCGARGAGAERIPQYGAWKIREKL